MGYIQLMFFLYLVLVKCQDEHEKVYGPAWSDLDTRPLPQWYDAAKIGIFIHWGVYSVPAFKSEWFWHFWHEQKPDVMEYLKNISYTRRYEDFVSQFTANEFDPDQWAELFSNAGAQYVVLTAKHHDGFTLFPSNKTDWNSMDVGPEKDLVGLLADSVRKYNMTFGVYYSLLEWFNEVYKGDKSRDYSTTFYTDTVVWPDIKRLVNDYKPSVLWADGQWEGNEGYWKSKELLAWLYNESPARKEIVVNDRWGEDTACKHGDFFNCEDRFNPRKLMNHKWEAAFTLDTESWSFRYNMLPSQVLQIEALVEMVVSAVSCGGNALINIGPTKEGLIAPVFEKRLLQLGEWLYINGEAIYDTSPWFHQRDSTNIDVWYTCKKEIYNPVQPSSVPNKNDIIQAIYVIFLNWPNKDALLVKDLMDYMEGNDNIRVVFLNDEEFSPVTYTIVEDKVKFQLPKHNIKSKYAWALKITNFKES